MQLRFSPTSPYVRKVTVCAIELGLNNQLQRVDTNPWDPESDITTNNPLGRVPALALEDGSYLYDSIVICEYLDSLSDTHDLFPKDSNRWQVLRQHALANGILDAGINAVVERLRRPEDLKWEGWVDFQFEAIRRALTVMNAEVEQFEQQRLNIAHITAGASLGYLDFRFADDLDWRADNPQLKKWYEGFSQRESMQATIPQAPA